MSTSNANQTASKMADEAAKRFEENSERVKEFNASTGRGTVDEGPRGIRQLSARVHNAAFALGSMAELSSWIGVSRSQPSRWANGETRPSAEAARAITDLDFIVARAALVWDESVIGDWLRGHSAFLSGSTPLDMVRAGRTAEVLEAITAESIGAYA